MNPKKSYWSLYLIIATILFSIVVQVYWNYKNYQENEKIFINTVQQSLDNALDTYFDQLADQEIHFTNSKTKIDIKYVSNDGVAVFDSIINPLKDITLPEPDKIKMIQVSKALNTIKGDSLFFPKETSHIKSNKLTSKLLDSLTTVEGLTSIFISITDNDINLVTLKPFLSQELNRKNIQIPFLINHFYEDVLQNTTDSVMAFNNPIKTYAKTAFLKKNEKIELVYPNQANIILKNGFLGILLSFLLSITIIASLFYLLNIIKKQKQLAEIKNDFISNITHEFKTPITTIGLATESIRLFNKQNNKKKTDEYLTITNNQLNKLNLMVEKVLETSVLESGKLLLKKEPTNLAELITKIINKHNINSSGKINFVTDNNVHSIIVDRFHFENALNNLLDNAIKYGGEEVTVTIKSSVKETIITVSDNGIIEQKHKDKIFDKFYRIPKGNTHNVKGFGIGLYYTKKIIEKHQGKIELLNAKKTSFKITLPNE